jgi:hypothetical protein
MPLCVAGMHRSGTSMIVRLLNLCGLHLGPPKDLLPAAPDNPEGFWEHKAFVQLNDAVLKQRGGRWDQPPPDEAAGWEMEPSLDGLAARASRLVRRFRGREPWGWKDPRNCLTLPFWKRVLPGMKVLICLRHPVAVAESLWARSGMSFGQSFDLWLTCNRRVLAAAPPDDCVVTHYDCYFHDPRAELQRVLRLLGIDATAHQLDQACAAVNPSLLHHRPTPADLAAAGGSVELVECYRALCAQAELAREQPFCRQKGSGVPESRMGNAMASGAAVSPTRQRG